MIHRSKSHKRRHSRKQTRRHTRKRGGACGSCTGGLLPQAGGRGGLGGMGIASRNTGTTSAAAQLAQWTGQTKGLSSGGRRKRGGLSPNAEEFVPEANARLNAALNAKKAELEEMLKESN